MYASALSWLSCQLTGGRTDMSTSVQTILRRALLQLHRYSQC